MKHTRKASTLARIPRTDIIKNPKQGYQWFHEPNVKLWKLHDGSNRQLRLNSPVSGSAIGTLEVVE